MIKSKDIKYLDVYIYYLLISEVILTLDLIPNFGFIRGGVALIYLGFLLVFNFKPSWNPLIVLPLVFLVYVSISLFFSNHFYESFYQYSKFLTSFLVLPVAYSVLNLKNVMKIITVLGNMAIIYGIYLILAIVFNIESTEKSYIEDEFTRGGVNTATLTFVVMMAPAAIMLDLVPNWKKLLIVLGIGIGIIFILVTLKRTSIILLAITSLIYFVKLSGKYKFQYTFFTFVSVFIVYITFPYWGEAFIERYEQRGERMEIQTETFETDYRTRDIKEITAETFSFENLGFSWFGRNLFQTVGDYGGFTDFSPRNRPLHNDFAILFHSTGIIGVSIYIMFLFFAFKIYFKFQRFAHLLKQGRIFSTLFLIILIVSTAIMYNGSLFHITHRTITMIFLGILAKRPEITYHTSTDQIEK